MSFYTSKSGARIDGSAEASHVHQFALIPDGTKAPAIIKKAELMTFDDGGKVYQITYKILDGEYQGFETRQKIDPFNAEAKKADRAMNMLVRLYTLCGHKPEHENAPSTQDLVPLINHNIGIVVRQWHMDGKEGNFISEIHALDKDFVPVTGKVTYPKVSADNYGVQSALTRNAAGGFIDEDVPF